MDVIDDLLSKCLASKGPCIDSRALTKGQYFFALRTEKRDGHDFVKDALNKGAAFVIIDNSEFKIDERCILVRNTLQTLHDLARKHRENLANLKVIAIAGSNGKTTTKELVTAVLSTQYKTFSTMGNLNNHLGVPLTILNISKSHEIAVIEMGANHLNEHNQLCEIAQPTYGLVTNCGKDHLEGYGSQTAVISSNLEVYKYIKQINGHVFVNENDKHLTRALNKMKSSFYGNITQMKQQYPMIKLSGSIDNINIDINTQLYGSFQKLNVEAAIHIGVYFKVSLSKIKQAIENYIPQNNRSQIIRWQENTVLLDAYNANPSSVQEMIDYFLNYPAKHKIIILGAMLELGDASESEHLAVLNQLKDHNINHIILVGTEFKAVSEAYDVQYFSDYSEVKRYLESLKLSDHLILVKGSRRFTLEKIFTP